MLEAGQEAEAVSYTKGCYIGQETLSRRIHWRAATSPSDSPGLVLEADADSRGRESQDGGRQRDRPRHLSSFSPRLARPPRPRRPQVRLPATGHACLNRRGRSGTRRARRGCPRARQLAPRRGGVIGGGRKRGRAGDRRRGYIVSEQPPREQPQQTTKLSRRRRAARSRLRAGAPRLFDHRIALAHRRRKRLSSRSWRGH